jgi:hypothetical protein
MSDKNQDRAAVDLAQAVKRAIELMDTPQQADIRRVQALEARAKYLAFVAAGFDAVQALVLCKS